MFTTRQGASYKSHFWDTDIFPSKFDQILMKKNRHKITLFSEITKNIKKMLFFDFALDLSLCAIFMLFRLIYSVVSVLFHSEDQQKHVIGKAWHLVACFVSYYAYWFDITSRRYCIVFRFTLINHLKLCFVKISGSVNPWIHGSMDPLSMRIHESTDSWILGFMQFQLVISFYSSIDF